jgi:hydrogenase/urease accessory protein HupE
MLVDFACGSLVRELTVQDDIFDVLGPDHHTLAKLEAPGGIQQFAFAPDTRQARFPVGDSGDVARSTGSFFVLGIHHILSGYDHLLFLLALLLPGGGLLSLLKIITAFTIAHSVTLSLAVLQVVTLPDRLVEAMIALSIAFVAAENLFLEPTVSRRWLVSFCFGLVHGFGFSSALRELGLPAHGLLLSLFGFNAGVEVGQALVVAVCLPLLLLLRRTRWQSRAVSSSSVAILLVGVVLFLERAFF